MKSLAPAWPKCVVRCLPSTSKVAIYFFSGFVERCSPKNFIVILLEMNSFGVEKGTTIRQPSTANLMIDSTDRNPLRDLYANSFFLTKNSNILNGFFSRVGVTEVELEWNTPNVSSYFGNAYISLDISGGVSVSAIIPTNFYTVYQAITQVAKSLSDLSGSTGLAFSVQSLSPQSGFSLIPSNLNTYYSLSGPLAAQLSIGSLTPILVQGVQVVRPGSNSPYIGAIRYLDFVSDQLTYAQDLKDATSSVIDKNVLVRFYFCLDSPAAVDAYGFPIELGYTAFSIRRPFNPPKQIKWDADLPIGQLSFQVYNQTGNLQPMTPNTNWCMTLQVSEN